MSDGDPQLCNYLDGTLFCTKTFSVIVFSFEGKSTESRFK